MVSDFLTPIISYTVIMVFCYVEKLSFPLKILCSFSYQYGLIDSYPVNIVIIYFDTQIVPRLVNLSSFKLAPVSPSF